MLETLKKEWNIIKEKVRDEFDITRISYETFIEPLELYDLKNQTLRIIFSGESSEWAINHITKKYALQFQITIEEMFNVRYKIVFISEPKTAVNQIGKSSVYTEISDEDYHVSNINPKYTFDTFVVGGNNQLAHAASVYVAENPGKDYNPLFIYGGPGLGKTHLMHAIANFIYKTNPKAKVLYVTSEVFMNEVIEAMRRKNNPEIMSFFKNKYRSVDILLIDDIQRLIGRAENTLDEFFNTFNYLYDNGKQIVISSDKPPKAFNQLEERLKSRFERGLLVDIQLPDYETRMAILREKTENEGYLVDNEILHYIATNIKSNIRVLEGALTKVSAYSKLNRDKNNADKKITLDVAKTILKDLIDPENERKLTPDNIISVVADYYGIQAEDIISQKRTKEISTPRHIAMYLIRVMTDYTLEDVGHILGNRDHTTIKYGFEKIMNEIKEKEDFKNTIEILKKKILQ